MVEHNLPKQLTPFVGREQAIADIETCLQEPDCHLLTLYGLGGIGKTRLAITLGERQLSTFPDGVWFIRLQPLASADWIVPTITETLNLIAGPEDPRQTLLNYLSDREMLLLLDNYEHLIDDTGLSLLTDIIRAAPSAKLIVTSREALNIQEEWRYSVSGLSFPSSEIRGSHELDVHEATRLFMICARRVNPDLVLKHEYADVVKICRLVDGLPLAIEMAASWLGSLSCKAIADRIEQGYLDTRLRNVPERHRSMATVFEQSWTLLSESERDILSRLSVFAGGFLWEAAHYITGSSSETLAVLVDKSLLQRHGSDRYYVHELTRQFAAKKLGQHSDHLELTLDRHCDYYASFLCEREQAFRAEQSPEILRELAQEIENIRMMWKRAIDRNKIEQIQGVVRFLAEYYDFRRWYQEGVSLLEKLIHLLRKKPLTENAHRRILGMALAGRGNLLHNLGEINSAEESLREALAILRPIKAFQEIAQALGHLNRLLMVIGKFREAETLFEECIVLARETHDNVTLGYALFNLISINTILGKYRKAQKVAQETNACFQNINHQLGQGMVGSVQGQ
ncbi:MAG: hypothetical protein K8L99_00825, partial [Anaerolineae bacterium]|nr:hypothetical protein [Anaerolineae bacterium]